MPTRITVHRTGGAGHAKRVLDRAVKAGLEDAVEHWHATYLPGHFTEAGFHKYDYQLRKGQDESNLIYSDRAGRAVRQGKHGALKNNPRYYWRKWREKRTHDPLVWTGGSKAAAMAGIRISTRNVKAESLTRAVGAMDLPKYFYQYRKDWADPIDKADELTRVTPDEQADLTRVFEAGRQSYTTSAPTPTTVERIT